MTKRSAAIENKLLLLSEPKKENHMNIIKGMKRTLFFVGGLTMLVVLTAQARPYIQSITAFGSGSDSDQSTARSYAKENAESSLVCMGTLQNVRSVVTGCVDAGSNDSGHSWTCMASATAQCVIGQ